MTASKRVTRDISIDQDDAPELTDEFFARADKYAGDKLVRRGRPRSTAARQMISLRVEPDVVAALRASGPGWQTRVAALLREAVAKGKV
jgi:uncharacterized protein (DUF4415 family)